MRYDGPAGDQESLIDTLLMFIIFITCSALFPDVLNCMQTDNMELKKLVYLYLMNYAKTQPDLTIMAVNTFQKVQPALD